MIADRYSLDHEIGRGGMGAVWLGHDTVLDRPVAMKRIGVAPGGSDPEQARAEREARLAASLSHPNVVSVYDLAPDGETQWLVMEHVDGTDLAAMVRDQGALSPDRAALVIAQVASALVAAHHAGVVHRDVKPSNILVTPEGQVKLSDFGIARTTGDASLTQTGLVTGSPAYLSPEVASGRSATDRSDVWSLGATAYHAVEGRPPYELGDNVIGALYRIVHEDPPRPTDPGWLAPLFDATMERDPALRWDAQQVCDFLAAGPASAPTPPAGRGRRPRRNPPVAGPASRPGTDQTQLLSSLGATTTAPAAAGSGSDRADRSDRTDRSRPVALGLGLVAAVVVVALLAGGLLLLGGGPDDDAGTSAAGTPSSTVAAPTTGPADPTTSPSSGPTEAAMVDFIEDYLRTAPDDPRAGFAQLTPEFKAASNGLAGYRSFWDGVTDVMVGDVTANPAALTVTYRYTYREDGELREDTPTLALQYADGRFLIAGESA